MTMVAKGASVASVAAAVGGGVEVKLAGSAEATLRVESSVMPRPRDRAVVLVFWPADEARDHLAATTEVLTNLAHERESSQARIQAALEEVDTVREALSLAADGRHPTAAASSEFLPPPRDLVPRIVLDVGLGQVTVHDRRNGQDNALTLTRPTADDLVAELAELGASIVEMDATGLGLPVAEELHARGIQVVRTGGAR